MSEFDADFRQRAAHLAEEIAAAANLDYATNRIEELIVHALLEAIRSERERCISIAVRRIELWEAFERRTSSPEWPSEGRIEGRERRKEAIVIADALREDMQQRPASEVSAT